MTLIADTKEGQVTAWELTNTGNTGELLDIPTEFNKIRDEILGEWLKGRKPRDVLEMIGRRVTPLLMATYWDPWEKEIIERYMNLRTEMISEFMQKEREEESKNIPTQESHHTIRNYGIQILKLLSWKK
jgi:hypothetical protein